MTKSYVSMEKKICPVCGQEHETGNILMDKRLKDSMEQYTVTGYDLCEKDQKLFDDGFIALVGCDPKKSAGNGETMKMEDAYRTGRIAHLRKSVWQAAFDTEAPDVPMVFVEDEVIDLLQQKAGG